MSVFVGTIQTGSNLHHLSGDRELLFEAVVCFGV